MTMKQLTEKAQEAVLSAQESATNSGHPQVDVEHLLAALVDQADGIVPSVLRKLTVPPSDVATAIRRELDRLPRASGGARPGISPRLSAILTRGKAEADQMTDEYTSTEHLLVAIASGDEESPATRILAEHGVTRTRVLEVLTSIRGSQRVTTQTPEGTYQALEQYGRDLTDLGRRGTLDPVIGRDEEIRRVIQVLSRRTKNNPVLNRRTRRRQDRNRRGVGPPDRPWRRAGRPETETRRGARHGRAYRWCQVSRRV